MADAFVLMTAMPPTKGHEHLIEFAASLPVRATHVIVCTQPSEPFPNERYEAVSKACRRIGRNVEAMHLYAELMQDPSMDGFWPMWDRIMRRHGFKEGDYVVSSEPYGATLAARLKGVFMPYDPNRELYYTKATSIREDLGKYFSDIMPEFQKHLVTKVTVFGAESTGKTTLSKELAWTIGGHWLFEWARPYLETVGPEITVRAMTDIWQGQLATQKHVEFFHDKAFVVQDTDLFSTIGYWEQPHWKSELGPVPEGLVRDALTTKSDLYVITQSNIPFEEDPIRYGGDHRESPDEYWIDLAKKYELNYIVLGDSDFYARLSAAERVSKEIAKKKAESIFYDRKGL